jgi:outer membrane protein, heavy metal efflux system
MRLSWLPAVLVTSALGGCAHYRAVPLRPVADILAPADLAALSIDAEKIERPYLTAQTIDLSQPLTPNAVAVIAVIENPDLKALRVKNGITEAQVFAARLLPDPTIGANFDKVLSGPDEFNAFGGQIGLDLNQLRTARVARESGAASKRQVRLDLAWAEWQTAGAARLQAVRLVALEEQLGLVRDSATSAQNGFETVMRAAGRGDLSKIEVDAKRQALIDATDKLRTTENNLATARSELNRLIGFAPETVLKLAAAREPLTPPTRSFLVDHALTRRLDLAALRSGYDAAEADVHKAVLEQFPNLSLTIAAARDTAANYTVGPAVGFTLPFWNRNRGAIRITEATRETLKAEYEARLFQTRAEIDAALTGLATVSAQRVALQAQLPALEDFARASERAATRGDIARATAGSARQAVRDRKLALLQLAQAAAEQAIALELLTGETSEGWTK